MHGILGRDSLLVKHNYTTAYNEPPRQAYHPGCAA